MAHKQTRHLPHSEFRHRSQFPLPAVKDVEQWLLDVLSPPLLAPRQLERRDPRPPERLIRLRRTMGEPWSWLDRARTATWWRPLKLLQAEVAPPHYRELQLATC